MKLTYTVQVDDHHNGEHHDPGDVDVTVTGTNDAPVITSSAQMDRVRSNRNSAGLTDADLTDTAHGTVTFTDADLSEGTHTVTVTGVTGGLGRHDRRCPRQCDPERAGCRWDLSANSSSGATGGSDGLAFSAGRGGFRLPRHPGQTVKLTYAVAGRRPPWRHHDTENVDITITGTNDAPVHPERDQSAEADGHRR